MTRFSTPRLMAIAAVLVTLAGCGGSSSKSSSSASSTPGGKTASGQVSGGLAAAAATWAQAVAAKDCAGIARAALAAKFPAASCQALETAASKLTVGRVAAYGDGGAVDLSLGSGKRGAAIFVRSRDRGWRYLALIGTARQIIGTHAPDPKQGEAVVARVLKAIAAGSCKSVAKDFPVFKSKTNKRKPANCFAYNGTPFQMLIKQGLGSARSTGGNARLAFYRVGLGKNHAHQFTVILLTVTGTPRFRGAFAVARPLSAATKKPATKKQG
jgi:hypothetical protein